MKPELERAFKKRAAKGAAFTLDVFPWDLDGAAATEEILPFHPGFPPYIPQIDGCPDNSTDDVNSKYPTHPPHQPLAEPATSPESINSDLDDSDTDEEDAEDSVGGNLNTMFCNFEKVSRNKAKWKCVLKNGVIHANGKDYLFSRCTGKKTILILKWIRPKSHIIPRDHSTGKPGFLQKPSC
ncbi:transcription factor IIA, alpha/beta subunit-domain-containing protein [Mycena sp. CBHHK59/15]|nr:transcription factor IIA, alpha/beta subunit-domain-containing protein [Mycena sp. CBHHK59/15]